MIEVFAAADAGAQAMADTVGATVRDTAVAVVQSLGPMGVGMLLAAWVFGFVAELVGFHRLGQQVTQRADRSTFKTEYTRASGGSSAGWVSAWESYSGQTRSMRRSYNRQAKKRGRPTSPWKG